MFHWPFIELRVVIRQQSDSPFDESEFDCAMLTCQLAIDMLTACDSPRVKLMASSLLGTTFCSSLSLLPLSSTSDDSAVSFSLPFAVALFFAGVSSFLAAMLDEAEAFEVSSLGFLGLAAGSAEAVKMMKDSQRNGSPGLVIKSYVASDAVDAVHTSSQPTATRRVSGLIESFTRARAAHRLTISSSSS